MKGAFRILTLIMLANSLTVAEITVHPAGIQVVWNDGKEAFGGFRTFNSEPGMRVSLLLESDGPSFTDVLGDECKLTIGGAEAKCSYFGQQSDLSEDGKEHEAKRGGWSRMSFGLVKSVEIGYKLDKRIPKAKMVVVYWKDLKKIKVPVDLTLGLGGPE